MRTEERKVKGIGSKMGICKIRDIRDMGIKEGGKKKRKRLNCNGRKEKKIKENRKWNEIGRKKHKY